MAVDAVLQKQVKASVGLIPRPQIRNLLASRTKKHAVLCFALSIGLGLSYQYFVAEPRKQKYADFWRNYDSHADFKRMVKAGVYENINIKDFEASEQQQLAELKKRYGKK